MDQQSSTRTKSWVYHFRYFKMWKNSKNPNSDSNQIHLNSTDLQVNNRPTVYRRSLTTNSLNETSPQLKRNENNLRRSLRKWHTRMKNCFLRNSTNLSHLRTIHIVNDSPSPNLSQDSRISISSQTSPVENIYQLDPTIFPRKCRSSISDQTSNSSTSPSRLTHSESQPTSPVLSVTDSGYVPKNEVSSLAHCVWYWGPASKSQVEDKLDKAPDGSFLVRDSTSDRYIFTISFRSVGITYHSRIEHTSSGYKLFDSAHYATVTELIEKAMEESEKGLLCYTKNRSMNVPNFPVRLLKPISRYDEVRSLQNLSRFVIRQHVNRNDIDKLCLPTTLLFYLNEENYFS